MRIPLIDLNKQVQAIKKEILLEMEKNLDNTAFIMGEDVLNLEQDFALYMDTDYSISCNSGTDALVLIFEAMDIGQGDEVITTPFTFFATAEAISRVGAIPVFVDVDRDTMNMDVDGLERAITARTKAVLPVHIFGQPADVEPLMAIAQKYQLYVLEDACQAIGATYTFSDGTVKKIGSIGDAAAFSFFPTKNLGAFGDGGMITTNDEQIAQIVKGLRIHGSGPNGRKAFECLYNEKVDLGLDVQGGNTAYDPTKYYNFLIGGNSRLDTLQAAVLNVKMKYLDGWNEKRRELAARYTRAFSVDKNIGIKLRPQKVLTGAVPVYHLYVVACERRDELAAYLSNQGIATGIYYPVPLHLQTVYQRGKHCLPYKEGDFPHSEWLSKRTIALPLYPEMTEEEQNYVISHVQAFYKKG